MTRTLRSSGSAVVQASGGQHVRAEHVRSQRPQGSGVDAPALPVAGRGEGGQRIVLEGGEGLQNGYL
ncbi:hypothetical protein HS99_0014580 [Kitasatospora aureofaciens]|uniref:Uncharacterized protein n=1 Tax=Kitasatospora aureofaciens TaxID=1894 RepID=A0A1E7MXW4_KITAU|nr:hypothetical protein HS99_0014580 [Kitasatospora aureofaciens]